MMNWKPNLSTRSKFFLSHFLAIVLVSGSIGTYFYTNATETLMNSLRSRLQNSAALLAQTLSPRELDLITSKKDIGSAVYKLNLDKLREFVTANPDVEFIYVMKLDDKNVKFVLDSDPNDPAEPGEIYSEQFPQLMSGFFKPSADAEITFDEWGAFLSGYAPIAGGATPYLLGIDIRADKVAKKFTQLRLTGIISLLFSILLAFIFSTFLARSYNKRIKLLVERCNSIADHRLADRPNNSGGDEMNHLMETFSQLAIHLDKSREAQDKINNDLVTARDELEKRVEERTLELKKLNVQLSEEIKERIQAEENLNQLANSDYLTGLLNRRAITEQLFTLSKTVLSNQKSFTILLVDVDHFKKINDSLGHIGGDQALIQIANALSSQLTEKDFIARWGGEEFMIVMTDTEKDKIPKRAEFFRHCIESNLFAIEEQEINITISIGVQTFIPGANLQRIIRDADYALYLAKARGRNCIIVYDESMETNDH